MITVFLNRILNILVYRHYVHVLYMTLSTEIQHYFKVFMQPLLFCISLNFVHLHQCSSQIGENVFAINQYSGEDWALHCKALINDAVHCVTIGNKTQACSVYK